MLLLRFRSEQVLLRNTSCSCSSFQYLFAYLSRSPPISLKAGLSMYTTLSTIFSTGFSMIFSTVIGTFIYLILSTKIGSFFLVAVYLSCLMQSSTCGSSNSVPSLSYSTVSMSLIIFQYCLYPLVSDPSSYLLSVSLEELVLMVLLYTQMGQKRVVFCRVMYDLSMSISCWRELITSCCLAITRWKFMLQSETAEAAESCRIYEFKLLLVCFIMSVIIEVLTGCNRIQDKIAL